MTPPAKELIPRSQREERQVRRRTLREGKGRPKVKPGREVRSSKAKQGRKSEGREIRRYTSEKEIDHAGEEATTRSKQDEKRLLEDGVLKLTISPPKPAFRRIAYNTRTGHSGGPYPPPLQALPSPSRQNPLPISSTTSSASRRRREPRYDTSKGLLPSSSPSQLPPRPEPSPLHVRGHDRPSAAAPSPLLARQNSPSSGASMSTSREGRA
jgi:hypothetical protein